jgi:hypothetical protein
VALDANTKGELLAKINIDNDEIMVFEQAGSDCGQYKLSYLSIAASINENRIIEENLKICQGITLFNDVKDDIRQV